MRISIAVVVLSLASTSSLPAVAQDAHSLPGVCTHSSMGHGAQGMDGGMMNTMPKDMEGHMSDATASYMQGMMAMNQQMMPAMMIEDPDIAFNCSMIAHHQGAIAMAETQLKYGEDQETKKRAQQVIDDQSREIAEMKAWLEKHVAQ